MKAEVGVVFSVFTSAAIFLRVKIYVVKLAGGRKVQDAFPVGQDLLSFINALESHAKCNLSLLGRDFNITMSLFSKKIKRQKHFLSIDYGSLKHYILNYQFSYIVSYNYQY